MDVSSQLHAPAALPLGEAFPCYRCKGGWVGPRPGLDVMEKRKISFPRQEQNSDSSIAQFVS
jgi:hypothetical protein